uniref:SAVED domain-containing protein n=1 Tax=Pseudomonas syringae TaxID=317 RepID=UPI0004634A98
STSGGLTDRLLAAAVYLAIIVIGTGLALIVHGYLKAQRETDSRRIAVLELRGLVDTSDTPLINAVPAKYRGRKEDCLVDLRSLLASKTPDVQGAIVELAHIPRQLRRVRGDSTRGNVQVVAGGVMQVPLLFYTGVLLDDEGQVALMDWERVDSTWAELGEVDSGQRFSIDGLEKVVTGGPVVLAISASYIVEFSDIAKTFPSLPLVHLARPNPKVNKLWSEDEQKELARQFLDVLCSLKSANVTMVHLVLAAPTTLAIRFGKHYDVRNMPPIRCYHWERNQSPPYPWCVEMPTDSSSQARHINQTTALPTAL